MKTQAQFLRVGDYLPLTKATVKSASTAGLSVPSGKVQIILQSGNKVRAALWNKTTEIVYERKEA